MDTRTVLTVIVVVLAVAAAWLLLSFTPGDTFLHPLTGRKASVALPVTWQIELGRELAPEVEQNLGGSLSNYELQQRVSRIGSQLVAALGRWERARGAYPQWSAFPFRFKVVASQRVNAFALPGGPIYITQGLLSRLKSDDQLAGVLGHELGHVVLRHSAQAIATNLRASALLWAIRRLLGQELAEWVGGAAALLHLKYSRDQELEADRFGHQLSCGAGYDPQGLIQVLALLQSLEKGTTLEILSTHPEPGSRIHALQGTPCRRPAP